MFPAPRFSGARAFERLAEYAALTPAPPGTAEHEAVVAWIVERTQGCGLPAQRHSWPVACSRSLCPRGEAPGIATLTNVTVPIAGRRSGDAPVLFGTHFDTRWIADREHAPAARAQPIPGVNDGGSGTAVLLELARVFAAGPAPPCDIVLAFFDGEDLGGLDGHPYGVGSRRFVRNAGGGLPAAAVILDMVGGADARYVIEPTSLLLGGPSAALFAAVFRTGRRLGHPAFSGSAVRAVHSDQVSFLEAGAPAALLIDIGYPEWHTLRDTLEACAPESLAAAGTTLEVWLEEREQ